MISHTKQEFLVRRLLQASMVFLHAKRCTMALQPEATGLARRSQVDETAIRLEGPTVWGRLVACQVVLVIQELADGSAWQS